MIVVVILVVVVVVVVETEMEGEVRNKNKRGHVRAMDDLVVVGVVVVNVINKTCGYPPY